MENLFVSFEKNLSYLLDTTFFNVFEECLVAIIDIYCLITVFCNNSADNI